LFANRAITTFAGIAPAGVVAFIAAQLAGILTAVAGVVAVAERSNE
jgi:hypothetical protein